MLKKNILSLGQKYPSGISFINVIINEYDIKSAHTIAYKHIVGEKNAQDILNIKDKFERNKQIGMKKQKDRTLGNKINIFVLDKINLFIKENNIGEDEILMTTMDSIFVLNKTVTKTNFDDVIFVNKNTYTSLYYTNNNYLYLLNSLENKLDIKGVKDEYIQSSYFVQEFLLPFLSQIEVYKEKSWKELKKLIVRYKKMYLNSKNPEIYKCLIKQNKFIYKMSEDDILYLENYLEDMEQFLNKSTNYVVHFLRLIHFFI